MAKKEILKIELTSTLSEETRNERLLKAFDYLIVNFPGALEPVVSKSK